MALSRRKRGDRGFQGGDAADERAKEENGGIVAFVVVVLGWMMVAVTATVICGARFCGLEKGWRFRKWEVS